MNIKYKKIRRVIITGKNDDDEKEWERAFAFCRDNGYRVVRSGPKQVTYTRYDTSRFKIIAEKDV